MTQQTEANHVFTMKGPSFVYLKSAETHTDMHQTDISELQVGAFGIYLDVFILKQQQWLCYL